MTTPENLGPLVSWSDLFMSLRDHLIKSDLVLNQHAEGFADFTMNPTVRLYVGTQVKFHQIYMMKTGGIRIVVSPIQKPSKKFTVPIGCLSYSCSPTTSIFSSFQPSLPVPSGSSSE